MIDTRSDRSDDARPRPRLVRIVIPAGADRAQHHQRKRSVGKAFARHPVRADRLRPLHIDRCFSAGRRRAWRRKRRRQLAIDRIARLRSGARHVRLLRCGFASLGTRVLGECDGDRIGGGRCTGRRFGRESRCTTGADAHLHDFAVGVDRERARALIAAVDAHVIHRLAMRTGLEIERRAAVVAELRPGGIAVRAEMAASAGHLERSFDLKEKALEAIAKRRFHWRQSPHRPSAECCEITTCTHARTNRNRCQYPPCAPPLARAQRRRRDARSRGPARHSSRH